ncbi:MAG: PDDEXK nuclease domain-containing protein [Bacteroidota bacterium]
MLPDQPPSLFADVRALIEASRRTASRVVNATVTMLNWSIGRRINEDILKDERAEYGKSIVATLSPQLQKAYGQGFTESSLWRMIRFYKAFSDEQIVATLSQQLTWSHFVILIPIKDPEKRHFYTQQIATHGWSVRQTRHHISRKVYERHRIGEAQQPLAGEIPVPIFKDPYFLDFLGLKDGYLEADLEGAILQEMQSFILEMGEGFSFIARQKRMIIDERDFYLDLLFYHRKLRRLIAEELKIGRFEAAHKGQMELYLRWLDRHERQPHEEAPIGLILCAEASSEQVELLQMHKDGIMVAEYWTELPPRKLLEEKVHSAMVAARERLARRQAFDRVADLHDKS